MINRKFNFNPIFSDKSITINEGGIIDWGDKDGSFPTEDKAGHAKALLLVARWTEDTSHSNSHTVLRQYKVKHCNNLFDS